MATTSSITIVNTSTDPNFVSPIAFTNSYKGDEISSRCAEILGLDSVSGWTVVDTEDDLALVHYTDDADKSLYGHIRGILIDLEVGAIIADSFGYTPIAVESELKVADDVITLTDTESNTHSFSLSDAIIKPVFEGVVIRVLWRKGKMYRITHKKINPARSRWGSSKSFITMYDEAEGPTAEQLFDTTKPYSNTTYDLLVADQSLSVATRQDIRKPYIVCLAQRTMDIKRPDEEVAPGVPTFPTSPTIGGSVTKSLIHDPKPFTISQANHHLKFGYYNEFTVDDPRQLTGEAVIIYKMTDGVISDIVKVHSSSYEWRSNLRGNNPNINNQFYSLLNSVYGNIDSDSAWKTFSSKFIPLPLYDEQSIKDLYEQTHAILTIPSGEVSRDDYKSRDSRIHLLWMNYVLCLPPHLQADGLNVLSQFKQDRNDVIDWLQSLEASNTNIESSDLHVRVKGLICSARRLAKDRIAKGNNYSAKGSYMKFPLLIKSTLRNLINKENGPSLYGLVREMKLARNPPAPKPTTEETETN